MKIRFWGTRGSIPAPGPSTVRYGGNTSCVEVRTNSGTVLVLDCGTGARALGRTLLDEGQRSGSLLISHTHWDHIQGLPFFSPLFEPTANWRVHGPRGLGVSLAQTLAGQMQYQYFPVAPEQLAAEVSYHDLVEGTFELDDVAIHTQYLNHPALALGYRIEADGVTLVYACDHEPFDPDLAAGGDLRSNPDDARHVDFLAGADVVIHDAQYTAAEFGPKVGWGHSTVEYVVDAVRLAEVEHTVLSHHDPARTDDEVDALVRDARARASRGGSGGFIEASYEGLTIEVNARSAARRSPRAISATESPALDELEASVVIAVRDAVPASAVRAAAEAEGLEVHQVSSESELVAAVDGYGRAVVVVDLDDDEELEEVRGSIDGGGSRVSVLGLTRRLLRADASVVTDWLVWPSSAAHVRTKLRAAVLRRACRWQTAPLPPDELERLEALRALALLDTPHEERFDRLTELACSTLRVPIALVSLIDADRQWFKSARGIDAVESPRDQSICAHAILGRDVLQVPDLLDDPRFADSPAATSEERIRFYAGVPLVLRDGSTVGTLCVVDHRPRVLDEVQLDQLRHLGGLVQAELEAKPEAG